MQRSNCLDGYVGVTVQGVLAESEPTAKPVLTGFFIHTGLAGANVA
jgi:hypothetical protein